MSEDFSKISTSDERQSFIEKMDAVAFSCDSLVNLIRRENGLKNHKFSLTFQFHLELSNLIRMVDNCCFFF